MAKLLKAEILTIEQIINKIKTGEWKYDITTQRQFIYNNSSTKKVPTENGNITKAAYVLHNILNANIILPAITIWHNTDTDTFNIHDGKQRSLSFFFFYESGSVSFYRTTDAGAQLITNLESLTNEDQRKLLDYQLVVQYNEGTTDEEKANFYEVNSNAIPLTDYENLRSVSFGNWIYTFEDYINGLTNSLTYVKPIGRGEQAIKFLMAHFDINDSKQAGTADISNKLLRHAVEPKIASTFNPNENNFRLLIETFNSLMGIKFAGSSKGLSEETALAIARFVVRNYSGRIQDVIELYKRSGRVRNDIPTWANDFNKGNLQTHKCFIKAYLDEGLELDPRRKFDDSEKEEVIKRDGCRCNHRDEATGEQCKETAYIKLEVDHVKPWSLGGRTEISNAQLLCKSHNTSKGNRE